MSFVRKNGLWPYVRWLLIATALAALIGGVTFLAVALLNDPNAR